MDRKREGAKRAKPLLPRLFLPFFVCTRASPDPIIRSSSFTHSLAKKRRHKGDVRFWSHSFGLIERGIKGRSKLDTVLYLQGRKVENNRSMIIERVSDIVANQRERERDGQ